MLATIFKNSQGVFKYEYRMQLFAAISVNLISFSNGISMGWLAPMLVQLLSHEKSPLSFTINIDELSWIGSLVCIGGFTGNITFGALINRIGRKMCIYLLVVPHLCAWILIYFANSVEYLYVARVLAGITSGGTYVVLPIFIAEISDNSIRGRLASLFTLALNTGILVGYILAAHLPYHIIPCVVIALPLLYAISATYFPETPTHLLLSDKEDLAVVSLQFYQNCPRSMTKAEVQEFRVGFEELKSAVLTQKMSETTKVTIGDFLTKPALKAFCTGLVLAILTGFSGAFSLIYYLSNIFAEAKVPMHPDTNTIIIGVIQIIGTYTATILVDRCGRKLLMILSTSGMGMGLALFGLYAYFVEQNIMDLSSISGWLPLCLMAVCIFSLNIGILGVTIVLLVEIMPPKLRSAGVSSCLAIFSTFIFISLKTFPISMDALGLSVTIWTCAAVCAFGLFYIVLFVKETKGKSLNKIDDAE